MAGPCANVITVTHFLPTLLYFIIIIIITITTTTITITITTTTITITITSHLQLTSHYNSTVCYIQLLCWRVGVTVYCVAVTHIFSFVFTQLFAWTTLLHCTVTGFPSLLRTTHDCRKAHVHITQYSYISGWNIQYKWKVKHDEKYVNTTCIMTHRQPSKAVHIKRPICLPQLVQSPTPCLHI